MNPSLGRSQSGRGSAHHDIAEAQAGPAPEPRRRCSPTWARLIAKVHQADPLVCTRCGQRMSLIAFVTDQMAIGKILDHLGLGTPQAAKPPPPTRSCSVPPSTSTAGARRAVRRRESNRAAARGSGR
jgi:hypothetical protein